MDSKLYLLPLLIGLLNLPLSSGLSEGDEVCLHTPYVTSVSDVTHTAVEDRQANLTTLKFTVDFVTDFRMKFRMENLTLILKFNDSTLKHFAGGTYHYLGVKFTYRGTTDEIALMQDKTTKGQATIWTNSDAYQQAKSLYEANQGLKNSSEKLIGNCYLNLDANFHIPTGKNDSDIHVRYRGRNLCYNTDTISNEPKHKLKTFLRTSAAFFDYPYLIQFAPHGAFVLTAFEDGNSTSISALAARESIQLLAYLSGNPDFKEEKTGQNFVNKKCSEPVANLEKSFREDTYHELKFIRMPLRTIFKYPLKDGIWASTDEKGTEALDQNYQAWSKSGPEVVAPWWPKRCKPSIEGARVQAMSYLKEQNGNETIERCAYVYSAPNDTSIIYNFDPPGEPGNDSYSSAKVTYPDDIVHWSKCKKLVSFYGYLYTMHDYGQDFIKVPSQWHLLDFSQFPYPIEAVHAEDDEFWFFSKMYNVDVMIADSSNCSQLKLERKNSTMHLHDLFKINSTYQLGGGFYYDFGANKWTVMNSRPTAAHNMLYILLIVGMALSIVIILIFLLLRMRRGGGDVIYSRSKRSNGLAEKLTTRSTLGSVSSKGARKTALSSGIKSSAKSPTRKSSKSGIKKSRSRSPLLKSPRRKSIKSPVRSKRLKSPGVKDISMSTAL